MYICMNEQTTDKRYFFYLPIYAIRTGNIWIFSYFIKTARKWNIASRHNAVACVSRSCSNHKQIHSYLSPPDQSIH